MRKTECPYHGLQGIGLVCRHIANATLREGPKVGFFYSDETDTARPDAWCQACETKLIALRGEQGDQWFDDAGFKVFCARCWDEARALCS